MAFKVAVLSSASAQSSRTASPQVGAAPSTETLLRAEASAATDMQLMLKLMVKILAVRAHVLMLALRPVRGLLVRRRQRR